MFIHQLTSCLYFVAFIHQLLVLHNVHSPVNQLLVLCSIHSPAACISQRLFTSCLYFAAFIHHGWQSGLGGDHNSSGSHERWNSRRVVQPQWSPWRWPWGLDEYRHVPYGKCAASHLCQWLPYVTEIPLFYSCEAECINFWFDVSLCYTHTCTRICTHACTHTCMHCSL